MNWSRGFFRLWVLFSLILCIVAAFIAANEYPSAKNVYDTFAINDQDLPGPRVFASADPGYSRLLEDKVEYRVRIQGYPATYSLFAPASQDKVQFINPYIDEIKSRLDAKLELSQHQFLVGLCVVTVSVSLVTLIFGLLVRWVLVGFKRKSASA